MFVEDEKDYIMRMIKQLIRALFSVILGREYTAIEMPQENKYEVSGKAMDEYLKMIDDGMINEAENEILQDVDYSDKQDIEALAQFYEYIGGKDEQFLEEYDYSKAEVLDGLKRVEEEAGFGSIVDHFIDP